MKALELLREALDANEYEEMHCEDHGTVFMLKSSENTPSCPFCGKSLSTKET